MNQPGIFAVLLRMTMFTLLALSCSKDPVLVFPEQETPSGTLSGFVKPQGARGKIYLLQEKIIDSCTFDTSTGYFSIKGIPFGSYLIRAAAEGWGIYEKTITVSSMHELQITLSHLPSQLQNISVEDSSLIGWATCIPIEQRHQCRTLLLNPSDTSVDITLTFSQKMDEASLNRALSVSPAEGMQQTYTYTGLVNELVITLPVITLFSCTTLTVSLDTTTRTIFNRRLDFPLTLHYPVAVECREQAVFSHLVLQTTPAPNTGNADPNTDAYIYFRKPLSEKSVEEALSVHPQVPWNPHWMGSPESGRLLRITFPGGLASGTRYRITIDTTAQSIDSASIPAPVSFSFTTARFRVADATPYKGQLSSPVDSPFVFLFDVPVDSTGFMNAFSISPETGKLTVTTADSGRKIIIGHQWLAARQTYKITIDSTLTSVRGTRLQTPFPLEFTTGDYPTIIREVIPPDTLVGVAVDTTVVISFSTPMVPSSFTSKITISPAVPFATQWNTDDAMVMTIIPLQSLRCATHYFITIDSGYTSAQGIPGDTFTTVFRTEPLSVTGFSPANGQKHIDAQAPIHIRFNAPIDTTLLSDALQCTPPLDSLTITPTEELPEQSFIITHNSFTGDTTYTITVSTDLTDRYGTPLHAPFTFSFSTGSP